MASATIRRRLLRSAGVRSARTVASFSSFGSEVDLWPLNRTVLRRGLRLALPRVDREARALVFHEVADLATDLVAGPFGIRQPHRDRPVVTPAAIDVLIAPGVAFDATGRRLGYGGGFYDAYLPQLRPDAIVIAIAFACQVIDEVPAGPRDVRIVRLCVA